jgi:transcriptional regulator with XRE-family HTH domain
MAMLTPYGKQVRKYRIDKGMTLREMAAKLDVTPAFLSSVETGRRPVPEKVCTKTARLLDLDVAEHAELKRLADASRPQVKVRFEESGDQEVAAMFARRFGELDDDDKAAIREILGGKRS